MIRVEDTLVLTKVSEPGSSFEITARDLITGPNGSVFSVVSQEPFASVWNTSGLYLILTCNGFPYEKDNKN